MTDPFNPLEVRASKRIGLVLKDKWRLDSLLGVGGMAAVYAATHRNGKRVAIKILHTELGINTEARERFLREGYVANKVNHPGAVSVLDDDALEDGSVFLVMELLDGQSLDAFAAKCGGRVPPLQVLLIAEQLLDVLEMAHKAGIVHRDLKPANAFLTSDGKIRVLDFGIARLREVAQKVNATATGVMLGTPAFMAPEQARGRWELVDAQTDIWAVGATLLALITGRDVHDAGTLNELLLAAMTQPAPPLASIAPGVPPQIAAIVDRALMFDKAQRWPTAAAMRDAVRAAYQALAGHPVTAAPPLAGPVASWTDADPHEQTLAVVSTGGPAKSSADPWSGPAVPAALAPPMATTPGVTHATGFPGHAPRSGPGVRAPVLIAGAVLLVILGIGGGVWMLVGEKGAAPATSAVPLPGASATEARPASGGSATAPPTPPAPSVPDVAPGASATAEATSAASAATASPTAVATRRRTATPTAKRKPPPPQPSAKGNPLDKRTR